MTSDDSSNLVLRGRGKSAIRVRVDTISGTIVSVGSLGYTSQKTALQFGGSTGKFDLTAIAGLAPVSALGNFFPSLPRFNVVSSNLHISICSGNTTDWKMFPRKKDLVRP